MNKRLSNLNILTASGEIVNFPSQFQLYWHRVESGEYVVRFGNSVWCNQTTIFICWWYHTTLTVCSKMRCPILPVNRTIWYQWIMKAFTVEERVIWKGCLPRQNSLTWKKITHSIHILDLPNFRRKSASVFRTVLDGVIRLLVVFFAISLLC